MKAALKIIFLCLGPCNSYILLVYIYIYIFTSAFFQDDSGEMEDYAAQEGHKCFVCWSSSHHAISSKEVPGCDLRVKVLAAAHNRLHRVLQIYCHITTDGLWW